MTFVFSFYHLQTSRHCYVEKDYDGDVREEGRVEKGNEVEKSVVNEK